MLFYWQAQVLEILSISQITNRKNIFKNIGSLLCGFFSDFEINQNSKKPSDLRKIDKLADSNNTGKPTRLPTISELEECGISTELPEFLYHLTSKENYKSMLKTGMLNQGFDHYCGSAVFAFDFDNFDKNWNNIPNTDVNIDNL